MAPTINPQSEKLNSMNQKICIKEKTMKIKSTHSSIKDLTTKVTCTTCLWASGTEPSFPLVHHTWKTNRG
jgi:hypothetical protein